MGVEVKVLKDGYSRMEDGYGAPTYANGTSTLIKNGNGYHVIVDTLTAWDRNTMINALKKEGLHVDDIKYVVCTHGHVDHIGLLSLFDHAEQHCVGYCLSTHEKFPFHDFENGVELKVCENVIVFPTPGHSVDDVSVKIETEEKGMVVISGDLFERKEDIKNPFLWKTLGQSFNPELQSTNREKVIKMADYIIPGHGPIFKVLEEDRIDILSYHV